MHEKSPDWRILCNLDFSLTGVVAKPLLRSFWTSSSAPIHHLSIHAGVVLGRRLVLSAMASNLPTHSIGVPRKAIGRKAVGSGVARSSSTISSTGSINSALPQPNVRPNGLILEHSSLPETTSPSPAYFDIRLHQSSAPMPNHHQEASESLQGTHQLERVTSTRSTASAASTVVSPWPTSPGGVSSYSTPATTPSLSRTTTGVSSASPLSALSPTMQRFSSVGHHPVAPHLPTCDQCRARILPNVSIFYCLICSTGGSSARFCVYCYTTGSAATGHSHHDPSFYVTESDPEVEPPQSTKTGALHKSSVPTNLWIVRRSATGRIWYQHRATGYRTHLQPFLTTVPPPTVPAGWEARSTPDGKKYYFNASTGASSWSIPTVKALPAGWIEIRTPDCRPFYVHQEHQLACWEKPGESPSTSIAEISPSTAGYVKSKNSGSSSNAVHGVAAAGAAVTLASSVVQLADAADLSPQGIISATVAAAKLTHHGAKLAGRKMNKLAKSKQIRRASKIFGSAAVLASIAGGDDFEYSGDCEDVEGGATEYDDAGTECGEVIAAEEQYPYQPQYTEATYQTSYIPMVPVYEQPAPVTYQCVPDTLALQPSVDEQQAYCPPPEEPAPVADNVHVTETIIHNETTIQEIYTECSQPPPPSEAMESQTPAPDACAPPLYDAPPAVGIIQTCDYMPPPDGTRCSTVKPPTELTQDDGTVPPLVFQPLLAGPMMVSPPAEQNGVIFAPTYV